MSTLSLPEVLPIDLTSQEYSFLASRVQEFVREFLEDLPQANVTATDEEVAAYLRDPEVRKAPAEEGRSIEDLLDILRRVAKVDLNGASGRAFAAVPGTGLVTSALALFLTQVMNNYTGFSSVGPGSVALETDVILWAARLMGLPNTASGTITSGGSVSMLSAMVVARNKLLGPDFSKAVVYCTEQTHFALYKALLIAGFPEDVMRYIPADRDLCMDEKSLIEAIEEDRASGRKPFCIAANAGTTSFGTVDRLDELAPIARKYGLWFHVDAAYGGFFQLTERGQKRMKGIELADSIVLDTHKSLFLPNSSSILLIREGPDLDRGFSTASAPFLRHARRSSPGGDSFLNFADLSIELTRPARGIAVWFPLQCHGIRAFRAALDEKLDLAEFLWRELSTIANVEMLENPHLSIIAFQLRSDEGAEADNELTRRLVEAVNSKRDLLISTTTKDDVTFARICVMSARSTKAVVEELLDQIRLCMRVLLPSR